MSQTNSFRNRIVDHKKVKAKDLVPHEFNFRTHPKVQRDALVKLYQEVGFSRSLLAYYTEAGQLKLIDGHLRRDIDPEMEVEVEILDVTEEEARKLLLSMDPVAHLAGTDQELLETLQETLEEDSEALRLLWDQLQKEEATLPPPPKEQDLEEKFILLVHCQDEQSQVKLWRSLKEQGLNVEMKTV